MLSITVLHTLSETAFPSPQNTFKEEVKHHIYTSKDCKVEKGLCNLTEANTRQVISYNTVAGKLMEMCQIPSETEGMPWLSASFGAGLILRASRRSIFNITFGNVTSAPHGQTALSVGPATSMVFSTPLASPAHPLITSRSTEPLVTGIEVR